jgi:signal peptidase I
MSRSTDSSFRDTVKTVLYAIIIALFVRTFAYEPFNIPSGSMIPTLLVGDYLFVSKFSYGYSRYSLPLGLPLIPDRVFFTQPKRGDVAVFKLPSDNKTDYIKRIIGLPGDKIQMIDGILHLNGKAVPRKRTKDFIFRSRAGNSERIPQFIETLPNGRQYQILEADGNQGPLDNTPVYSVPKGHVFAMGDNRDQSKDSRFINDVGFIPMNNLVGGAKVLFFSIDGSVWQFWKWPSTVRGSRIFNSLD